MTPNEKRLAGTLEGTSIKIARLCLSAVQPTSGARPGSLPLGSCAKIQSLDFHENTTPIAQLPSNWWFGLVVWRLGTVSHLPSTRTRDSNPQTTNPHIRGSGKKRTTCSSLSDRLPLLRPVSHRHGKFKYDNICSSAYKPK